MLKIPHQLHLSRRHQCLRQNHSLIKLKKFFHFRPLYLSVEQQISCSFFPCGCGKSSSLFRSSSLSCLALKITKFKVHPGARSDTSSSFFIIISCCEAYDLGNMRKGRKVKSFFFPLVLRRWGKRCLCCL